MKTFVKYGSFAVMGAALFVSGAFAAEQNVKSYALPAVHPPLPIGIPSW
jgi:hypothetical protein